MDAGTPPAFSRRAKAQGAVPEKRASSASAEEAIALSVFGEGSLWGHIGSRPPKCGLHFLTEPKTVRFRE